MPVPTPDALLHHTIEAAPQWRTIDFVSDIHLHQPDATWQAFASYINHTPAQAIFLLGDIFEIWVGDDILEQSSAGFTQHILTVLGQAARRGISLFWMHGNRDFLFGAQAAACIPCTLLADPCVLHIPQAQPPWQRLLLSHGDVLCLDDVPYQQFRALVRQPAWQQQFLAQPLAQRLHVAQQMRSESETRKQAGGFAAYADVDARMACQWLLAHGCTQLIHGHTHRPGHHLLAETPHRLERHVLTDWDWHSGAGTRAGGLRLHQGSGVGWQLDVFHVSPDAPGP